MASNDVVLVQPKVGDWDTVRSHPSVPLALLTASSFLEKEYKVKIIDQRIDEDWKKTLANEVKSGPLFVGVTSITGRQIRQALEALKVVRENGSTKTLWGGIHASLLPKQTLENENIDFVIEGEGEITLLELARALGKGTPLAGINGLWYKEKGEIKNNAPRPFIDLNTLPDVPYHLVDLKNYMPEFQGRRTLYLETSRGCPFRCTYCYNRAYNKSSWRAMSAENALRRMRNVVEKLGVKSIYLVDDNFFVDIDRAGAIAQGIVDAGWDLFWESQGIRVEYVERMSDDYMHLLEKSGCKKLHFGAESGSDRILELVKKGLKREQIIGANKRLTGFDFQPQYNFMVGYPTETVEDIRSTISLMFKLLEDNPKAGISATCILTPYVGTELFDTAIQQGLKVPSKLEEWAEFSQDKVVSPWVTPERRRVLGAVFFTSLFMDKKAIDMVGSPLNRNLAKLYRPVARYRLKHMMFNALVEPELRKLLVREE